MPLSDDAMVVRGGTKRDADDLRVAILKDLEFDGPVLSVWCADRLGGESREEQLIRICQAAEFDYGQVQVGRFGDVRNAITALEPWVENGEPPEHHHATFDDDVPLGQVADFVSSLGEPETNPDPDRLRRRNRT